MFRMEKNEQNEDILYLSSILNYHIMFTIKRLGFDYCNYNVDWYTVKQDKVIVSKCENFINENEELISAYDVFQSAKKRKYH